jgi:hypothetical protein
MGLSGVVAFLFVIEPSAHLIDPGRPVMPCQSGLSPSLPPVLLAHEWRAAGGIDNAGARNGTGR